ncbi:uncharacterized protein Z520_11979 [Fonsecaea multimorphosa CBS 102226]|uniref:Peptidase C14 caspase domain-containing protein n=1 Tax=Fonsecaea multimorphosa CBS 102226 TaxID=1442371 RepID=A0A0D2I557_9EURO|nr:uncharacterized protein Z520_11979 [Fonsecaea multimorphosa CBS 102226]KIX92371.1 hypothetical protein Z520_11979 [Fonsecaea multimorphosa CBS 102226]
MQNDLPTSTSGNDNTEWDSTTKDNPEDSEDDDSSPPPFRESRSGSTSKARSKRRAPSTGGSQQSSRAEADRRRTEGHEDDRYKKGEVLLLTFSFTDLDEIKSNNTKSNDWTFKSLKDETAGVKKAFEDWKYAVDSFDIPMEDSTKKLKDKLGRFLEKRTDRTKETLLVVYYHGHGGEIGKGSFGFTSHNYPRNIGTLWETMLDIFETQTDFEKVSGYLRSKESYFQKEAKVHWKDLSSLIMDAQFDTLVILDCCDAGLAALSSRKDRKAQEKKYKEPADKEKMNYCKELVGACSWANTTENHMSPALCLALEHYKRPGNSISMATLVRYMNDKLGDEYIKGNPVPQAVHYVLGPTKRRKIFLQHF